MKVFIRLEKPLFGVDCIDYEFDNVDTISNGTHLEVRDATSRQLEFKCRLDNVSSLVKLIK